MYINKVIFMESDEVKKLEAKYHSMIVQYTDYGTTEILASTIQDLIAGLEGDNTEEYNFTKEELLKDLNNSLGTDVVELLLNDSLDFILVV